MFRDRNLTCPWSRRSFSCRAKAGLASKLARLTPGKVPCLGVDPIIADSARKHERPRRAHAPRPAQPDSVCEPDDEGLTMFIGPRPDGGLLEVGVVNSESGPVIVHANRARPKFL